MKVVQETLGFARDLLSPNTRVTEHRAGAHPYRWDLERRRMVLRLDGREEGEWVFASWMCLLLWNFFGRRTERIYQNAHLPGRPDGAQESFWTAEGRAG